MMKPVAIEQNGDAFVIIHTCEKCGKTIRQHSAGNDNIDTIISVSTNQSFIFGTQD